MAMVLLTRLAMDRAYVTRPSGVMSTIFVSTASTASSMLVAAAEAAMAADERERWRPVDHVRYLMMLGIWVHVWGLRVLMNLFPPSCAVGGGLPGVAGSSSALVVHGGIRNRGGRSSSTTAIGRALSHILRILNEIPATSRKYEYVLAMADKILNDNVELGHAPLLDVNRAVLASAFARTCDLLRRALQRSESAASGLAWPSRVLRLLPLPLGPRLAACYDGLRLRLSTLLPSAADAWHRSSSKFQHQLAIPAPVISSHEWLEAEKLAHELLWITNKLRACSAADEAITRWGAASDLASLSLTAHPRVQGPLVKITAVLYRELEKGEWEAPRGVRFGILALWLPLLCFAGNGVTCPVLVGLERWEMERVVEDLIAALPLEDQEVVLRNWLEDFAASYSDWPNLQRCFDQWCRHSRKLLM